MLMPVGCPDWRVSMPEPATDLAATFAVRCPYCSVMVMVAKTITKETVVVDADPSPFGTVKLLREGRRLAAASVEKARDRRALTYGGWPLFSPHRLVCTRTEAWAKTKAKPVLSVSPPEAGEGLW